MRHSVLAALVLAILIFAAGCASHSVQFAVDGPQYPGAIGLHFGPKLAQLASPEAADKNAVIDLTNQDLYNHIRTAFVEAMQTGFLQVVDVSQPPPYTKENMSGSQPLLGIVDVELQDTGFVVPVIRLMPYSVSLQFATNVYGPDGSSVSQMLVDARDSETLVIGFVEFQAKSKYNKLAQNAARQAAAKVLRESYAKLGGSRPR